MSDIPGFNRHQPKLESDHSYDFVQLQESVGKVLDGILDIPWLNGVLLENVSIDGSNTNNLVVHGLGRQYRGYIELMNDGVSTSILRRGDETGVDKKIHIPLKTAGSDSIYTIWVW